MTLRHRGARLGLPAALLTLLATCGGSQAGASDVTTMASVASTSPTSAAAPAAVEVLSAAPAASAAPIAPGPTAAPPAATPNPATLSFTNQNWGQVSQAPQNYVGASVHLSGQVFNVEQDASRIGVQIWTDPLHAQGNTVVVFPKAGFPAVGNGDQIQVDGSVMSVFAGKNDSGQVPKVEATKVSILSHASPTPSVAARASAYATSKPAASHR